MYATQSLQQQFRAKKHQEHEQCEYQENCGAVVLIYKYERYPKVFKNI